MYGVGSREIKVASFRKIYEIISEKCYWKFVCLHLNWFLWAHQPLPPDFSISISIHQIPNHICRNRNIDIAAANGKSQTSISSLWVCFYWNSNVFRGFELAFVCSESGQLILWLSTRSTFDLQVLLACLSPSFSLCPPDSTPCWSSADSFRFSSSLRRRPRHKALESLCPANCVSD